MFDLRPKSSNRMKPQAAQLLNLILFSWLFSTQSAGGNQSGGKNHIEQKDSHSRIERLIVLTTIRNSDESFERFNRSVETYNLDLNVLALRKSENRLASIRNFLRTYRNADNLLVMIVDGRDCILNGNQEDIVNRFRRFDSKSRVIFAADTVCWPDSSLSNQFARPLAGEDRYLNSKALVGFASALWDLLEEDSGPLPDDSQLFFVKAYLNETTRDRIGLRLDQRAEIFQSLRNSMKLDLRLELESDGSRLKNLAHSSEPVVAIGNNESRISLNSLGNYLAKAWTPKDGCRHCEQSKLKLADREDSLPTVLIGIFIEYATPFMEGFFENILNLQYSKAKVHLLVHNSVPYHEKVVGAFLSEHGAKYASQQVIEPQEAEWRARDRALVRCIELSCDYYLSLDPIARLELPETLRLLIEANKKVIAPLLNRPTKLWSNFWGSMSWDGYYERSHDYVELVKRDRIGVWNVAHVMNAYLLNGRFIGDNLAINSSAIERPNDTSDEGRVDIRLSYRDDNSTRSLEPVLMFTQNLRDANIHQYMINTHEFGHLVDPTNYNTSLRHPDFYQLAENVLDWERAYLHDNYTRIIEDESYKLEQPCPDVFWFPLVSGKFCSQLIEIMESFGQWSGGTNHDPRIEGGYESVPTRDIHMKQVSLHEMWLLFLRDYIMPVQLKEYIGYEHDPPRANLAFVVRYHPAEQASLQPHHDSSTYTLNIALNTPGLDYEGGGCRFERYNCSVTQSRLGWALVHPGRLTHYHEGLPVTNGTRYIMVTFVDP